MNIHGLVGNENLAEITDLKVPDHLKTKPVELFIQRDTTFLVHPNTGLLRYVAINLLPT